MQTSRGLVWIVCALLVLVGLFAWLGTMAEQLILGWLYFPLRVVPQMTVDPPAAFVGLAALVLLIAVIHMTARWLMREAAAAEGGARSWSFPSTLAMALLLLLMFAAGTAMVGATHQIVWLATGRATASQERSAPVEGFLDQTKTELTKMQAGNNLKQFAIGVHTYHDTWKSLPAGGTVSESGELLHGWAVFIGPQTGYVAEGIDYSVPWNQPPNDRYYKCNLAVFVNPSLDGPHFDQQGFGLSHFAGNVHVLPLQRVGASSIRKTLAEVSDGSASTVLIGTVVENFKPWGHPANLRDPTRGINQHPDGFGGPPSWGGAQFAMCDGSVRFLSNKIDPKVMAKLAKPGSSDSDSHRQINEAARAVLQQE